MPCPSHAVCSHVHNIKISGEGNNLWSSPSCNFPHPLVASSPSGPNIPTAPCNTHPQPVLLDVTDQEPQPYKIICKVNFSWAYFNLTFLYSRWNAARFELHRSKYSLCRRSQKFDLSHIFKVPITYPFRKN
jgi:hypothetical protein